MAEQKADQLRQALEQMMSDLDRAHFRRRQREGFMCSAKCCDSAQGQRELQECIRSCEHPVQMAQQTTNAFVKQFQERLQRCVARCQDTAQEGLPAKPSEGDIGKAQTKLATCVGGCADEYRKLIPKLRADIVSALG